MTRSATERENRSSKLVSQQDYGLKRDRKTTRAEMISQASILVKHSRMWSLELAELG